MFELAFALVGDDFTLTEIGNFAGIDYDMRFKIEHALEFTQSDIEQVADAGRQTLEEPDVRTGAGEFNVAQAFAANAGERYFNAALVADDAAVLHPLVLAAEAFPVSHRSENTGTEKTVTFRLEGPVVDGFRFGNFAVAPASDFLGGGERDPDRVEIRN